MKIKYLLFLIFVSFAAISQELQIPRFASLKSDTVYLRVGPGERFPIEWIYKRAALPVEIIDSYENWYKIKDYDNTSGWIHKKMFSGKRYALTPKQKRIPLYKKADEKSIVIAYFDGQSIVRLHKCSAKSNFCFVSYDNLKGYIQKSELFGVYPDEDFD